MKTTICFCRHGETKWNAKQRYQWSDAGLTKKGRQEIKDLKAALSARAPEYKWDIIIVSGLCRTQQSAELLFDKETNFIEITSFNELDDHISASRKRKDRTIVPEKQQDFERRVIEAFSQILDLYRGKTILLMLHRGTLEVISRKFMHFENVVWETGCGRIMEFENQKYIKTIRKVK